MRRLAGAKSCPKRSKKEAEKYRIGPPAERGEPVIGSEEGKYVYVSRFMQREMSPSKKDAQLWELSNELIVLAHGVVLCAGDLGDLVTQLGRQVRSEALKAIAILQNNPSQSTAGVASQLKELADSLSVEHPSVSAQDSGELFSRRAEHLPGEVSGFGWMPSTPLTGGIVNTWNALQRGETIGKLTRAIELKAERIERILSLDSIFEGPFDQALTLGLDGQFKIYSKRELYPVVPAYLGDATWSVPEQGRVLERTWSNMTNYLSQLRDRANASYDEKITVEDLRTRSICSATPKVASPSLGSRARRVRGLKKRLSEIQGLISRRKNGDVLNEAQLKKIERMTAVAEELKAICSKEPAPSLCSEEKTEGVQLEEKTEGVQLEEKACDDASLLPPARRATPEQVAILNRLQELRAYAEEIRGPQEFPIADFREVKDIGEYLAGYCHANDGENFPTELERSFLEGEDGWKGGERAARFKELLQDIQSHLVAYEARTPSASPLFSFAIDDESSDDPSVVSSDSDAEFDSE